MRKCPKCGKNFDDSWETCLECRDKLVPADSISESETKNLSRKAKRRHMENFKLNLIQFFAGIFAIPVIGILMLFRHYFDLSRTQEVNTSLAPVYIFTLIGCILSGFGLLRRKVWAWYIAIIMAGFLFVGTLTFGFWALQYSPAEHALESIFILFFACIFPIMIYLLTRPAVRAQFK